MCVIYLQVGGVGQANQALMWEVLAGESRDHHLGGTAKSQQVELVGRVAGMIVPTTKEAIPIVTLGATTLTKMIGN